MMSDKVEAGQVWYDRKTGDQRIVCDVGDSIVHWRTPTGKRRGVGKYLPHWLQDMSPTPIEPKLPSPTDAVIAAARKIAAGSEAVDGFSGVADEAWVARTGMGEWTLRRSDLSALRTALTAYDAATHP